MNDKMTSHNHGAAEQTDATGNTQITDITQVVSCAVGHNRYDQRRQKIREELVREYFSREPDVSPASPTLRKRLLKLLKID